MKHKVNWISIAVCLSTLLLGGCGKAEQTYTFDEKAVIEEREDGWYYFSTYSYSETSDYRSFVYNAYNLKHHHLEGYDLLIKDKETGEVVERATTSLPYLSLNPQATADVQEINSFFANRDLPTPLRMENLSELNLTYIDKQEVLDFFNRTVAQEPQPAGKYHMPEADILQEQAMIDGYRWQIGYFNSHGNILAARIELLCGEDQYLSDMVANGSADAGQTAVHKKCKEIETYIVENQTFVLEQSMAFSHAEISFDRLKTLLENLEKEGTTYR